MEETNPQSLLSALVLIHAADASDLLQLCSLHDLLPETTRPTTADPSVDFCFLTPVNCHRNTTAGLSLSLHQKTAASAVIEH